MLDLSLLLASVDLTVIATTFDPAAPGYTFFSATRRTVSKIDHDQISHNKNILKNLLGLRSYSVSILTKMVKK